MYVLMWTVRRLCISISNWSCPKLNTMMSKIAYLWDTDLNCQDSFLKSISIVIVTFVKLSCLEVTFLKIRFFGILVCMLVNFWTLTPWKIAKKSKFERLPPLICITPESMSRIMGLVAFCNNSNLKQNWPFFYKSMFPPIFDDTTFT